MIRKTRQERVEDHIKLVADTLIQQIEKGTAPWQRPWKPGERPLAHNLLTKNNYQGYNQVWLNMVGIRNGFTDTRWGTYRQIKEVGGQVRRGEKGQLILAVFEIGQKEREQAEREARDRGDDLPHFSRRMVPKVYTIFNAVQADGLPPLEIEKPSWKPCDLAEEILRKSGIPIKYGGERAYYNLTRDTIHLPHKSQFDSPEKYYVVALHELAHATGHPSRLNRELLTYRENTREYAREELRAEISAMMTCTQLGLGYDSQNGGAYVKDWVSILKDTPEEVRVAAAEAQKMSSYLLRGMGKETELPDLSWTVSAEEQARDSAPQSEVQKVQPKDIQSTPDVMGSMKSWTELSEQQQMIRNGWGPAGKAYRSQPEWSCLIEKPKSVGGVGLDFTAGNLIGAGGKLHGSSAENVARMHITEVEHRNPGVNLSDYAIRVRGIGKNKSGGQYEFRVRELTSKKRHLGNTGARSLRAERNVGMER